MFRRWIVTLVFLGFLAEQVGQMPHAHAGFTAKEQQEHSARPHVHLGTGGHTHGHHHGHSHHHHRDSSGKTPTNEGQTGLAAQTSHDADALYAKTAPIDLRTPAVAELSSMIDGLMAEPASLRQDFAGVALKWHPPDSYSGHVKLFLKLRSLRN
jgi:hypothetical protein